MAALLAAMAWTGCQNRLELEDPEIPDEKPIRDSVTLTIEAGKSADTKGLELVTENSIENLNAFWRSGEVVKVFTTGSASAIGTLTATPKEDKTKATLSGTIVVTGLSAGQTLILLYPKETWSYEGQTGRLLHDEVNHPTWSSIEKDFDYARAVVTITEVSATSIITSSTTTFENQQSIVRFGFRHGNGGPTIRSKTVLITSNRNQLAKTVNATTGENTYYTSGEAMRIDLPVALTQAEADANTLLYFAIRNGNKTQEDTFTFTIYDADGATFKGSKTIPASIIDKSFISAKNVGLSRLELTQGTTTVTTAL